MLWRDLVTAARSCVVGWGALSAIILLIDRPLLHRTAPILGASWLPTAQLAVECLGLAAVGWLIGRWGNAGVLIFAATLALFNFRLVPSIDVPWLFHLLLDSFQNARYLESFSTSLATHIFLFASLFIGSHLSRAKRNRAREQTLLRIK
jgi:hypothetical protein